MEIDKQQCFDRSDFLWLFRQLNKPAFYLSPDYSIVDMTSAAEPLFSEQRQEILGRRIAELFKNNGLQIFLPKNTNKSIFMDVNVEDASCTKHKSAIANLSWQLKKNKGFKEKESGFILLAKKGLDTACLEKREQTDTEYLEQLNQLLTREKDFSLKSIRDYAESIRDYYESIIAFMPNNVYWMDKNCVYLGCNDNVAKALGLSARKEVVGKTYEDFTVIGLFTEEQNKSFKHDDLKVMATATPIINIEEPPVVLSNGKEAYYLTSRVPLLDTKGEVIGVVGISVDITDRKIAEQELQKSIARESAQQERINTMQSLGTAVAHELRTPLRTITANAVGVDKFLPKLIDAYEAANVAGLVVANIQPRYLKKLKMALDSIEKETSFANTIIDMLLMNIKAMKMDYVELETYSIILCVNEALNRYPFNVAEKSLVHWDKQNDFLFKGKKLLIVHVLFNLLKNALYYIAKAKKGDITIWLEPGEKTNKLYFKDTGTGISEENLAQIFSQFFSTTHSGTGIGLNFCKMVMQSIGGDIICRSKEREFTEFILSFEVLK